jgi:hypothetical protein
VLTVLALNVERPAVRMVSMRAKSKWFFENGIAVRPSWPFPRADLGCSRPLSSAYPPSDHHTASRALIIAGLRGKSHAATVTDALQDLRISAALIL